MKMKMRNIKRCLLPRQGATAVEFALVSPILFLLIFACIEFGRIMMIEAMVEQSAFEAARNVAVLGATTAEGEEVVGRELSFFGVSDPDVSIQAFSRGATQTAIDDSTDEVSVTVSVNYSDFMFLSTGGLRKIERTAILNTERF